MAAAPREHQSAAGVAEPPLQLALEEKKTGVCGSAVCLWRVPHVLKVEKLQRCVEARELEDLAGTR